MTDRRRLLAGLRRGLADAPADAPLVVAVSGGRDSVVLLHLLRFAPDLVPAGVAPPSLVAAHFDHGMRPDSAADARWVTGLCRAWGVHLESGRAGTVPGSEAAARSARYAFLHDVREAVGARWVLTAHHADDQAETVLYRAVRGTGLRGLRGMAERRRPGVWRPLLGVRRTALAAYAEEVGLTWREDPTNRTPLARNVLRREVLPRLEKSVAPDPVGALVGLAGRARRDEAAWASLMPELLRPLDVRWSDQGVDLLRAPLLERHPGVRVRVLRALARRLGTPLGGAGTRVAVEFISAGTSGTGVSVGGGLTLERALDRLVLRREAPVPPDRPLRLDPATDGQGLVRLGGRGFQVRWRPGRPDEGGTLLALPDPTAPVDVRGWRPGDRIRMSHGSRKLKKVFLEARIPVAERHRTPVVVDAAGRILWVRGVRRAADAEPVAGRPLLHIEITDADIE